MEKRAEGIGLLIEEVVRESERGKKDNGKVNNGQLTLTTGMARKEQQ